MMIWLSPSPRKKGEEKLLSAIRLRPTPRGSFGLRKYTEGKKPLLYTLFEPTEGGSAIPAQNTPQVRLTYEVNVNTGSPDLMALRGAARSTIPLNGRLMEAIEA